VGSSDDLEVIRSILAWLDDPPAHRSQAMQVPLANWKSKQERTRLNGRSIHDELGRSPSKLDQSQNSHAKASSTAASAQKSRLESQATPLELDVDESWQQLMAAKAELDRLDERYGKTPALFSSSELAKAKLAVRCAEIRVEKLRAMHVDSR
jgi:hypothetical protein